MFDSFDLFDSFNPFDPYNLFDPFDLFDPLDLFNPFDLFNLFNPFDPFNLFDPFDLSDPFDLLNLFDSFDPFDSFDSFDPFDSFDSFHPFHPFDLFNTFDSFCLFSLLPEGPDFTARMACHKMPRDNIVVFGCTQTSTDLYYWDLDTDVITKSEYECPTNQGIFGVESNNRLIMTGKTKRSYRFRLNNGFKNYPKAELNHFRGAAFAAPDGTYTCDE